MVENYRSYLIPVLLALMLHVALGYLVAGRWFEAHDDHRVQAFRHVKAELVDLTAQTKAKQEAEKAAQRKAEAQRKKEQEQRAEAKRRADQAKHEKLAADKKRKAEAEKKKQIAAEKQRKADAERKRQADIARMKEAEKRAQEKKEAAAQAHQEAEELAAQRREEERQRLQQIERQLQAERLQREAEAELARMEQAQRAAEEAAVRIAEEKVVVASAVEVIRDGIQRNWRRPPSARNGMEVGVRIHLLPTGEVDDAYVVESSGDDAFDRSAVNAVLKAERFPELQGMDPVIFDRKLRQLNLKFRPEDLRL